MGKVISLHNETQGTSEWPLIPPGEYQLGYLYHETRSMFRQQPKVCVWFSVIEFGDYFGTKLCRFYNAESLKGKARKNGQFVCKPRSDVMYDYALVFNRKTRRDRVPLSQYGDVIVIGKVETVCKDYRQRELPRPLQYSIIRELLGKAHT